MYKGDVARMIFYMATVTSPIQASQPDAAPCRIFDVGAVSSHRRSMAKWGFSPITSNGTNSIRSTPTKSIANNLIDRNFQHNRNPYIDHPEWGRIVYDTTYSGSGATIAAETSSVGTNPAGKPRLRFGEHFCHPPVPRLPMP
jgi:hypothetical protein